MKFPHVLIIGIFVLLILIVAAYTLSAFRPTSEQEKVPFAQLIEKMQDDVFPRQDFFLIDDSLIFVARTGFASDYSFHHILFDKQQRELCSFADNIAGPQLKCQDETKKEMFQTMVKNTDKGDLGLTGHTVKSIYQKRPNFK